MTTEHILQACPTYANLRRKHWPEDTAVTDKLYSAKEGLQQTAAFIEESGESERSRKKKKNSDL
jgi:hypothetical protein